MTIITSRGIKSRNRLESTCSRSYVFFLSNAMQYNAILYKKSKKEVYRVCKSPNLKVVVSEADGGKEDEFV